MGLPDASGNRQETHSDCWCVVSSQSRKLLLFFKFILGVEVPAHAEKVLLLVKCLHMLIHSQITGPDSDTNKIHDQILVLVPDSSTGCRWPNLRSSTNLLYRILVPVYDIRLSYLNLAQSYFFFLSNLLLLGVGKTGRVVSSQLKKVTLLFCCGGWGATG